jgi:hypothetical protein
VAFCTWRVWISYFFELAIGKDCVAALESHSFKQLSDEFVKLLLICSMDYLSFALQCVVIQEINKR